MARRIAFLIFPDFQLLDAAGPISAFEIAERYQPGSYELRLIAPQAGSVASTSGVTMNALALGRAGGIDTLVISGGEGTRPASQSPRIVKFVGACGEVSRRVASVCSGAFLLAKAGLMSGRRATTHWEYAARFQQMHPDVKVECDQIFIQDGNLWSSGGVTAGIDLSLAIIEADLGQWMAQRTARVLVVYHRRYGGQSQFSAMLEMEPATDRLRRALEFARDHLHEPLPVERLAESVHVGARQLSRLFLKEMGETPAKAVERLRAEAAHAQLTGTAAPIAAIARQVGFENAERMRRAFVRLYGNPPQALRRIAG